MKNVAVALAALVACTLRKGADLKPGACKPPAPAAGVNQRPVRATQRSRVAARPGWTRLLGSLAPLLTLLPLLTGCRSPGIAKLPPYRPPTASAGTQQTGTNGLAITVLPVTDPITLKAHFGADLVSYKVLPIYLQLQNQSPATSYILCESNVVLWLSGQSPQAPGSSFRGVERAKVRGSLKAVAGMLNAAPWSLMAPPLGVALMLRGQRTMHKATTADYNTAAQRLPFTTLVPGQSAEGFVYFQLPEKHVPQQYGLTLTVAVSGEDCAEEFQFLLP